MRNREKGKGLIFFSQTARKRQCRFCSVLISAFFIFFYYSYLLSFRYESFLSFFSCVCFFSAHHYYQYRNQYSFLFLFFGSSFSPPPPPSPLSSFLTSFSSFIIHILLPTFSPFIINFPLPIFSPFIIHFLLPTFSPFIPPSLPPSISLPSALDSKGLSRQAPLRLRLAQVPSAAGRILRLSCF